MQSGLARSLARATRPAGLTRTTAPLAGAVRAQATAAAGLDQAHELPPYMIGDRQPGWPQGQIRPPFSKQQAKQTLPPDNKAIIRELETFHLPQQVTGSAEDIALGKKLVESWRTNGILQIQFPGQILIFIGFCHQKS